MGFENLIWACVPFWLAWSDPQRFDVLTRGKNESFSFLTTLALLNDSQNSHDNTDGDDDGDGAVSYDDRRGDGGVGFVV